MLRVFFGRILTDGNTCPYHVITLEKPAPPHRFPFADRSSEHRLNYSTVRLPNFLSSFRIQSYRFQWGSDLLNSWAFEMETLILGWFVLVTTDSPFLLAAFAALTFSGTLLSPFFGVLADRVDRRTILIILRVIYGCLASVILLLALVGTVQPWHCLLYTSPSPRDRG